MKTYYKKGLTLLLCSLFAVGVSAQRERTQSIINSYLHGWEYSIKAGFNIGGTAPLPLPEEIRSIDSYAPGIAIAIEGNATKADAWTAPGEQEYEYGGYREELRYEDYQRERRRAAGAVDRRSEDESEELLFDGARARGLPHQQPVETFMRPVCVVYDRRQLLRPCV